MKKVVAVLFLTLSISGFTPQMNSAYGATDDNKFKPQEREQPQRVSRNSGPRPQNNQDIQMLREELQMQLEEMRALKEDLIEIKENNKEEQKEKRKKEKRKKEARFIGIIDGTKIYQDKDTGEYFNLAEGEELPEDMQEQEQQK